MSTKEIKAWLVVDENGEFYSLWGLDKGKETCLYLKKPKRADWHKDYKFVPVTITYSLTPNS